MHRPERLRRALVTDDPGRHPVAQREAEHGREHRQSHVSILGQARRFHGGAVEGDRQGRRVEHGHHPAALRRRQRIEQLADVRDPLGEPQATGFVEQLAAFGEVDVARSGLRQDQAGEQHQDQPSEEAPGQKAH